MTEDRSTKRKGTSPRKRKLPPAGLAADVLGAVADGDPDDGTGDDGSPRADAVAEDVPSPVRPTGPERIFDFADSLEDRAEAGASHKKEERVENWVTFELADETFALPVTHVQEILRVNTITAGPHAPHPVRGVTNKRGRVLPVVDLRVRLGLSSTETGPKSRILVVESRGRLLGLLVDAVYKVVRILPSGVQAPPADVMTAQSDYILGVYEMDQSLVILLDVDLVLVIQDAGRRAG